MRWYWSRVSPWSNVTCISIKRRNLDTETKRQLHVNICCHEPVNFQTLRERPGIGLQKKPTLWHLDHGLLAFRTVRRKFLLVKPPSVVLRQPWEMDSPLLRLLRPQHSPAPKFLTSVMNHRAIFQPPEFRSSFFLHHLTRLVPNPFNSTQETTFSSLYPSYWHSQSLPRLLLSGNNISGFLTLLYFILFNAVSTLPPTPFSETQITDLEWPLQSDLNLPLGSI